MKPLSKAAAGDDCTISWLMGLPEAVDFLKRSGVRKGSVLHVVSSFAGSVLVRCGGRRFAIDCESADRIQVSPCRS